MKTALTLHTFTLMIAAAATLVLTTVPAQADNLAGADAATRPEVHALGQHPAVRVHARLPQIDPNHFLVQPPASVTWVRPHSNGEHPAVLVARKAADIGTGIDSNTFIVQPPVQVTWTVQPVDDGTHQVASAGAGTGRSTR